MRIPFLFILLALPAQYLLAQTSLQNIGLKNGSYTVGFSHYKAYDSTRTYTRMFDWNTQSIPRPILTSIWYPAENPSDIKAPLDVLDYMEILKIEEEWEHLPNEQILNWFYYANTAYNQRHLKENTTAFRELTPDEGRFPVVVYTPSYQASSIENFRLCEYLASQGYIVISSTSRGADNRFFVGGTAKDMETQARDVEFLIHEIGKMDSADMDNMALMGFSFGGLSNMVVQMRNENVKAVISLDGTERYNYKLLTKSPFFDSNKIDVPYLHMAQKDIPEEVMKADKLKAELNYRFQLYDSIQNATAHKLKFHDLTHSYFSTLGVLFQTRDTRQDKDDIEIMQSYKWVSEYVLNFLNANLKGDKGSKIFMENELVRNGVPEGLISKNSKQATDRTFDFRNFNELALEHNYDNLFERYQQTKEAHPEFEIPEGALNNLGLQLVFNPETSDNGIKVFQFAVKLYPESANLYDSMAEGYLFLGNEEKAIESFERSLKLDSNNQNAIRRLEKLK